MKFGFLVFDGIQLMDLVGPLEVINMWKMLDETIEAVFISDKKLLDCGNNISLNIDYNYNDCPRLDYLIVPGGYGRVSQMQNHNMAKFISKCYNECQAIAAVCTGVFLLYSAGVLSGHSVSSYWRAIPELSHNKDIKIIQQRIVQSGKIWTSGGVTSGIDMTLALINHIAGQQIAGQVQLLLEYFPSQKIYATLDDINHLPPYPTATLGEVNQLPDYISQQII